MDTLGGGWGWVGGLGGGFEHPSPHSFPPLPASLPHAFPTPSPYPPRFAQARLADDGGARPDAGPRPGPTGRPGSDGRCGGTWESTMLAREAARVRCTQGRLTHITFARARRASGGFLRQTSRMATLREPFACVQFSLFVLTNVNNVHTRSRTWVVAATTRRPNH